MSEKEVRNKAETLIDEIQHGTWGMIQITSQVVEQALSEPPDVVVLLRKIYEELERTAGAATVEDEAALVWVVYEIQKIVRLTADGWEWVEEGE